MYAYSTTLGGFTFTVYDGYVVLICVGKDLERLEDTVEIGNRIPAMLVKVTSDHNKLTNKAKIHIINQSVHTYQVSN